MKTTRAFIVLVAAAAAAGCGWKEQPPPLQPQTPVAKADPTCEADTSDQFNCAEGKDGKDGVCSMLAYSTKTNAVVFPYNLRTPTAGTQVTLVWELRSKDSVFDVVNKDGPEFKNDADQFKDGSPATDPEGATPANQGKYYRITYINEKTPRDGIKYVLQYTQGGKPRRCDPVITNSGG